MRRIIGIIGFILFSFQFYQVVENNKDYTNWVESFFGNGFLGATVIILGALSFFIAIGFFLMIFNLPFHNVLLSGRRGEVSEYSNINDFIKYRNGIMGGMSPEKSAELMNDTAVIDQLMAGGYGSNTKDTLKYINGRLGGLNPDSQVLFLRGEKK